MLFSINILNITRKYLEHLSEQQSVNRNLFTGKTTDVFEQLLHKIMFECIQYVYWLSLQEKLLMMA